MLRQLSFKNGLLKTIKKDVKAGKWYNKVPSKEVRGIHYENIQSRKMMVMMMMMMMIMMMMMMNNLFLWYGWPMKGA